MRHGRQKAFGCHLAMFGAAKPVRILRKFYWVWLRGSERYGRDDEIARGGAVRKASGCGAARIPERQAPAKMKWVWKIGSQAV